MRVFVYFNLHKKVFSVKALEGPRKGRVVAHLSELNLGNVTFKVSQAGRERVLREQRKNVHAGVVGEWYGTEPQPIDMGTPITYNPYLYSTFVKADTKEPVYHAREVHLKDRRITALGA